MTETKTKLEVQVFIIMGQILAILFIAGMVFLCGYILGQKDKADRIFTPLYEKAFKRGFDSAINKRIFIKVDSFIYKVHTDDKHFY